MDGSMTPLERAARALHQDYVKGRVRMGVRPADLPACEELGPDGEFSFYAPARAVLQAIREPSEAMVHAWFDAPLELPEGVSWQDPSSVTDPYQARSDWRAMIDAALREV